MMINYAFREMTYVRDVVDKSFVDVDLSRFHIFGSTFILISYLILYP